MMPFAVTIENVTAEGQARWVLAVSGNRILTADPQGALAWHHFDKCRVCKVHTPDTPSLVMPVPPKGKPVILAANSIAPPQGGF
jgi:hypothetical protein